MNDPIVLAHGIAPFDELYRPFLKGLRKYWSNTPDKYDYFKGIASHLRRHGFTVFVPRVSFAGSVRERAKELAQAVRKILDETKSSKVHVIAHSMGGLDARRMIVDEDMQEVFPIEVDHLNELGWWDLDQLHRTRWWHFNLRKEIRAFEDQVKAAYLTMAQEAARLVAL